MKYILIFLVLVSSFFLLAVAEEAVNTKLDMPRGFEGIYLEMPVKELLQIRPNVSIHPMERDSSIEQVDSTKLNQSLYEFVEKDSLFGLNMFAMYVFRDGELKNMLVIWTGAINEVRKYRVNFVASCEKRWGTNYQRRVVKIQPNTRIEHLAPLLLWEKGNAIVTAVCTSEYEDKALEAGVFMINIFSQDDKEMLNKFSGETTDENTRIKLFQNIGISPQEKDTTSKE